MSHGMVAIYRPRLSSGLISIIQANTAGEATPDEKPSTPVANINSVTVVAWPIRMSDAASNTTAVLITPIRP